MRKKQNELPPWATKLILGVFFCLVVPFAIYGFFRQVRTGTVVAEEVAKSLVKPYLTSLQKQDWAAMLAARTPEARKRLTTADLKAGYAENLAPLGKPLGLELRSLKESHDPSLGQHWYATLMYTGTKGQTVLGFVVRRSESTAGPFAIEQTLKNNSDMWVRITF
jgi:hypothetical protein